MSAQIRGKYFLSTHRDKLAVIAEADGLLRYPFEQII